MSQVTLDIDVGQKKVTLVGAPFEGRTDLVSTNTVGAVCAADPSCLNLFRRTIRPGELNDNMVIMLFERFHFSLSLDVAPLLGKVFVEESFGLALLKRQQEGVSRVDFIKVETC